MDRPLRFGALLLPSLGWAALVRRATELEQVGFDAIWIDDHVAHPSRPELPWLESFGVLAGLATVTKRATLGPLVANIVLRHPALLASQALTVAELSSGRLDLGIGSGYAEVDHAATDQPPWPGRERARRFAAAVEQVRERLDAAPAFEDAVGLGRIPLTVAAHGPQAIAVAARYADTWVSYGGFGLKPAEHLELTKRRIAQLEDAGAGRQIRRRLLCGSGALTAEPIWRSVTAFDDFVGRYREIGIGEFAFHWPPTDTNPGADPATVQAIVSRLQAAR